MTDHLSRHREAMRRHRTTRALLATVAGALVVLALICLAHEQLLVAGTSLVVSLFFTEGAARAGRDYRIATVRAQDVAQHGRPPTVGQRLVCCDTWVSSAGRVHGARCDGGRWVI